MKRISVSFNYGRQKLIFVINGSIKSFRNRNDCDAYYCGKHGREDRNGIFGYIHTPDISNDLYWHELVSHEAQHAIIDWVLAKAKSLKYLIDNEEKIATTAGEISRKFWRKYEQAKKQKTAKKNTG